MTETAVYLQPAFILQQQPYRESSLIIDVLTRDYGRISLIAKGVRKPKSKTANLLQAFVPLNISYVGKAELKILADVENIPPLPKLTGLALYCGFYINELTGYFLHQHDPHPEVYADYRHCLYGLDQNVTASRIEAALRIFEYGLLEHVGYGLQLEYDACNEQPIDPAKKYVFNSGQGLVEAAHGLYSGTTLHAIKRKEFTDPQVLSEAKRLMRTIIDSQMQGRPLKSRIVINQIINKL
ncbi:MAG: DNA repair protein RecO [Methylovulum sp.]|nr:DNA repair protein RecO [Methylovulum sp.]